MRNLSWEIARESIQLESNNCVNKIFKSRSVIQSMRARSEANHDDVGLPHSPDVDVVVISAGCHDAPRLAPDAHAVHRVAVRNELL